MNTVFADVNVIGGGPAGAAIAARLAMLGYRVCVVERNLVPAARVAASLPATILPLLEMIGVRTRFESSGFLRAAQSIVWWAEPAPVLRPRADFHIDRTRFDPLLLQHAQDCGAHVLQPVIATRPQRIDGGWRTVTPDTEVLSRFLVDAAGNSGVLPGKRRRVSEPLIALYAEWTSLDRAPAEGRVEAGESEWFWYAPVLDEACCVAVFTDPQRLPKNSRDAIDPFYRNLVARFRLFQARPRHRQVGPTRICDASSYASLDPVGDDYIRIGDANFTLDPLSSQGIQSAIATALQAAAVVNTLLQHPERADLARRFFTSNQEHIVARHAVKAASLYAQRASVCNVPFWTQRSGSFTTPSGKPVPQLDPEAPIRLCSRAEIRCIPVLQGDLVAEAHALCHPSLERPVAYVGGVEIAPLLRQFSAGQTAIEVATIWSRHFPLPLVWGILRWLAAYRILIGVNH